MVLRHPLAIPLLASGCAALMCAAVFVDKQLLRRQYHARHASAQVLPKDVERQLQAFVKVVRRSKACRIDVDCVELWRGLLQDAVKSGHWTHGLDATQYAPEQLEWLFDTIDNRFLGDLFAELSRKNGSRVVKCKPVLIKERGHPTAWGWWNRGERTLYVCIGQFHESRVVSHEGFACETHLERLIHIVAHEMVHAMVDLCFEHLWNRKCITENEYHGSVFWYLNYNLFGHTQANNRLKLVRYRHGLRGSGRKSILQIMINDWNR